MEHHCFGQPPCDCQVGIATKLEKLQAGAGCSARVHDILFASSNDRRTRTLAGAGSSGPDAKRVQTSGSRIRLGTNTQGWDLETVQTCRRHCLLTR